MTVRSCENSRDTSFGKLKSLSVIRTSPFAADLVVFRLPQASFQMPWSGRNDQEGLTLGQYTTMLLRSLTSRNPKLVRVSTNIYRQFFLYAPEGVHIFL